MSELEVCRRRGANVREILREVGVAPDRVRLLKRGGNTHWAVTSGRERFVLRRYGADGVLDRSLASVRWELALVAELAARGFPAAAALQPPREIGGAIYALFRYHRGRRWRFDGSEQHYRRLGGLLADYHAVALALPARPQRAGWRRFADGALPASGGTAERARLLNVLRRIDSAAARLAGAAAREIAPRIADSGVRRLPMLPIHGDFSPWNLAFEAGALSGVFDFDLAHLDVRAADLSFARRGHHDGVVRGYRERAAISAAEVGVLDALWKASILAVLWRQLARSDGALTRADVRWISEQLSKTRGYRD